MADAQRPHHRTTRRRIPRMSGTRVDYFSDRERETSPPTTTELTKSAWRGIAVAISNRIADGSFGAQFPERCPDGTVPIGTAIRPFWSAVSCEIPELHLPELIDGQGSILEIDRPSLFAAMDLLEFCWRAVGRPTELRYHSFFNHSHLRFDVPAGQSEFRATINRIFSRTGMAYELTNEGVIERLIPDHISSVVHAAYHTGDADLDSMLSRARRKFLSPNKVERHESLQILWNAWERAKTLDGRDKRSGIRTLLDKAAGSDAPKFRAALEEEARKLTSIGNDFQIRHSETDKERLRLSQHVDYVAGRMFTFIYLILEPFRDVPKELPEPAADAEEIPF